MISSRPLTPYVRTGEDAPEVPTAWSLHELHAPQAEIFFAPTTDIEPTNEELAALEAAEREQLTSDAYDAGVVAGRASAQVEFQQLCGTAMSAVYAAALQIEVTRTSTRAFDGSLPSNWAGLLAFDFTM